ncbi:MAG TPA: ComEA family DNA-binding protein [Dehalococcoidia bacterium]|nr:ComEA family DNA-binding protein [Dehalococcoidia bacterium]
MLSWIERHAYVLLAVAALALAGGLVFDALQTDSPGDIVFHEASEARDGEPIRVHVAGAVVAPGVYDLQAGDRVEGALAAAGGATSDADLDAINLARRLRDGEQVVIPAGTKRSSASAATVAPLNGKLDLNTATQAQLEALPAIGEAYSRRIVDSRAVDGPYKSIDDLVTRKVVPNATFEKIRDLVAVAP